MKNIIFKAAFSAATIASAFLIADEAQMKNLNDRVCMLEQTKGFLSSAGPNLDKNWGGFFGAEYLYLKPHVTGMSYATLLDTSSFDQTIGMGLGSPALTTPSTKLSNKFVDFRNFSGSRVFIGLRPNHDAWELKAAWTYLHAKAKGNATTSGTERLLPTSLTLFINQTNGNDRLLPTTASSKWGMNLNIIDLDLSRNCAITKWLSLRPYVGLRNMWQYQNFTTTFGNASNSLPPQLTGQASPSNYSSKGSLTNNFWGIGPKLGLESAWGIGRGFSILGDVAASLLWGFYKTSSRASDSLVPGYLYTNQHSSEHSDMAILDLSLALAWDKNFYDNQYHIGFKLGWENHMFFENNMFGSADYPNGSTTLQGLVVGGRFDF